MSFVWPALLALVAAVPMGWALWAALVQMADVSAWQALWADPQTWRAWGMTLWTGLASTGLVWWSMARVLASGFMRQKLGQCLSHVPALLATPHAAMAVGLVLWLSPSGWALRWVSPGLTGFEAPPPWPTTQDPWGLGLILALWLKELPFLLWVAATQMQREDLRRRWQTEYAVAQTLGHTPRQAFAQVVWPQLAPRLRWPLLAVLAYGLTVVDMALIIGPASPPTLAVLAWQWLGDADLAVLSKGVAAAGLLTASVAVLALAAVALWHVEGADAGAWRRGTGGGMSAATSPPSDAHAIAHVRAPRRAQEHEPVPLKRSAHASAQARAWGRVGLPWAGRPSWLWGGTLVAYGAVWWALAVGSVSGVWPFPQVWPSLWTGDAWMQVMASARTVWTTLGLAVASASLCLVWSMAWLESASHRWQQRLRPGWLLPMVLPSVLWVLGLYSLALQWRQEGQWLGLCVAHAVMVLPYVLLALEPAYRAVDPRQAALVASLGHGRWRYWLRIKWPLLKRAIASAWAVGFAVSVAQYLPTQYVGAGRFATVTTEAVALAAGGQRTLMSAYAVLQMFLPLLAFAVAAALGRPRQFEKIGTMKDPT